MEHYMSGLNKKEFFPLTTISKSAWQQLHLTTIVAGLLLSMIPFLTGCGGEDGGAGDAPAPAAATGIDASLAWQPVQDPSVSGYFVHYGRQSPGQAGSCAYEGSTYSDSPSATVTNLEPETLYYFTVSAYNGLESACSSEVSTVTPAATPPAEPSV
jgi:hypothetical protein